MPIVLWIARGCSRRSAPPATYANVVSVGCLIALVACVPAEQPSATSDTANATGETSGGTGESSESQGTTGATTSTGASTGDPDTSDPPTSTSSGGGSIGCSCTPGEIAPTCMNGQLEVCADNCITFDPVPCPQDQICSEGTCVPSCEPGTTTCVDENNMAVCNDAGTGYGVPHPCSPEAACSDGWCLDLCAAAAANAESVGCEFMALPLDNFDALLNDVVLVTNPSPTLAATVEVGYVMVDGEQALAQGAPLFIPPGEHAEVVLDTEVIDHQSRKRQGGVFLLRSNVPVTASLHAPSQADGSNDASLLLPRHNLGLRHVVASYPDADGSHPGYFTVIAFEPNTHISWTPKAATTAGQGVPATLPGQTSQVELDRFGILQVQAAGSGDLTGTIVDSDRPIALLAGAECVNVPSAVDHCDHLSEQMLPQALWSTATLAVHAPVRDDESFFYRVLAGEDGTAIEISPPPVTTVPDELNRGEWFGWTGHVGQHFSVTANAPILGVQYLQGGSQLGLGDPSMIQMIAPDRWTHEYVFTSPTSYTVQHAQLIRAVASAHVMLDGEVVGPWTTIPDGFQTTTVEIGPGNHRAVSSSPFGLSVFGYAEAASYAHPAGFAAP